MNSFKGHRVLFRGIDVLCTGSMSLKNLFFFVRLVEDICRLFLTVWQRSHNTELHDRFLGQRNLRSEIMSAHLIIFREWYYYVPKRGNIMVHILNWYFRGTPVFHVISHCVGQSFYQCFWREYWKIGLFLIF